MTRGRHPSLGASPTTHFTTSSAPRRSNIRPPAGTSALMATASSDSTSPSYSPSPAAIATGSLPTHDWPPTTAAALAANKVPNALFHLNQTASSRTESYIDTSAPSGCGLAAPAAVSPK
jgi:hypothetical protein